MENEQDGTIIDPTETNEIAEVEEIELELPEEPEVEEKPEEKPQETPEAKKARLTRQLEQHNKKFGFSQDKPARVESTGTLSHKDTLALVNASVHEDDVDEVLDYAKYKGISVAEALKSTVIKTSLAEKAEQRSTAEATSTSKSRGTSSRTTPEALLAKAQKTGELPESDEDMEKLADARLNAK